MNPVATPFFFYFLSAIAIISAILVITRRNPVHSALPLIITLLAQAGPYLMLYAPFVAGVQILVYAGGIMVLYLFVIMLVNIERAATGRTVQQAMGGRGPGAAALGGLLLFIFVKGSAFPRTPRTCSAKAEHAADWPHALPGLPAAV